MPLIPEIVDAHFHFFDPTKNSFNEFLGSLGAPAYLPEHYHAHAGGLPIKKTVHIEAMPDDAVGEAKWIESLADSGSCKVAALVAGVDLSSPTAVAQLDELKACCPRLRGIRYILDFDGPFDGTNATHVNMKRHKDDACCFMSHPKKSKAFEHGFAQLASRGLSFDLQCAPAQLPHAVALCTRHPNVPVVIDHLGKPRHLKADGGAADMAELECWRAGMKQMAALPQVYVKLSMLGMRCLAMLPLPRVLCQTLIVADHSAISALLRPGYAVPGWCESTEKEAFIKSLVLEVIELFGAERCMFASNFHISPAGSDSDGASDHALEMPDLYARYHSWVAHLPEGDKARLFSGTACEFYKI